VLFPEMAGGAKERERMVPLRFKVHDSLKLKITQKIKKAGKMPENPGNIKKTQGNSVTKCKGRVSGYIIDMNFFHLNDYSSDRLWGR